MSADDLATSDLEKKRLEFQIEQARADLAERRAQRESEDLHHAREMQVKEKELSATAGKGIRFTTAQATVAAAILTLVSGILGGAIQALSSRSIQHEKSDAEIQIEKNKNDTQLYLERVKQEAALNLDREKFESTLIMKAVDTPDRNAQINNLQFFLQAGFITDKYGKIAAMAPSRYPTPTQSAFAGAPAVSIAQKLLAKYGVNEDADQLNATLAIIRKMVTRKLNPNQEGALVSFVNNVGAAAFRQSTLLRDINTGDFTGAVAQFQKWSRAAGGSDAALVSRRADEAARFQEAFTPQPAGQGH